MGITWNMDLHWNTASKSATCLVNLLWNVTLPETLCITDRYLFAIDLYVTAFIMAIKHVCIAVNL